MPPKPTTSPPLNDMEKLLMLITAKIIATTKYGEEHPHQADPNLGTKLLSEAVHYKCFFIICYLIIFRDIYILDIYNKFPPLKGDFHCTHPTTSANSGCYHSTMVDYSRAGRAGSAGSAGRNLNVCGSLW